MKSILENLDSPAGLKELSAAELEQLAAEIRETIIDTVAAKGGHLASVITSYSIHYTKLYDTRRKWRPWRIAVVAR